MARIYEFVKEQVVSLLARGELISSKSQKDANPRREASRILQELVGTPGGQRVSHGREPNRPIQPHAQPNIRDATASLRRGESLQPHPLSSSNPAEHRPRVFIRSKL